MREKWRCSRETKNCNSDRVVKQKTAYIVVRIDYETDGRHEDNAETDALAGDLVVERALAHSGTVEDGIRIVNITNWGESA